MYNSTFLPKFLPPFVCNLQCFVYIYQLIAVLFVYTKKVGLKPTFKLNSFTTLLQHRVAVSITQPCACYFFVPPLVVNIEIHSAFPIFLLTVC